MRCTSTTSRLTRRTQQGATWDGLSSGNSGAPQLAILPLTVLLLSSHQDHLGRQAKARGCGPDRSDAGAVNEVLCKFLVHNLFGSKKPLASCRFSGKLRDWGTAPGHSAPAWGTCEP